MHKAKSARSILVKYLPVTNHRPSRWKASLPWDNGAIGLGSRTLPFNHALNDGGQEETANLLLSLLKKLEVVNPQAVLSHKTCIGSDSFLFIISE